MGVFSRITDIVNSNINTMLDEAEDPAKMVRMITQEMEETLCTVRSTSARYMADRKRLGRELVHHERQEKMWESKAELAVSKGRDDLARAALAEKSAHGAQIESLTAEQAQVEHALNKLQQDADQLREKLRGAKVRQKALVIRGKTAQSRVKVKRQLHDHNYEEALTRFEAYERKLDDLEGEIEAYDLHKTTLAQEIDALDSSTDVADELSALKDRMSKQERVNE